MTKAVLEAESQGYDAVARRSAADEPQTTTTETRPSSNGAPSQEDMERILELEPKGKLRRWILWGVGAAIVAGLVLAYRIFSASAPTTEYRTSPVERGSLTIFVSATGSLVPTDEVDVGSELSGTVASVAVDANDTVHRGQVLARIDTSKAEAVARQSRASLDAAHARVQEAEASLAEMRLAFDRARELHDAQLVSQSNLDTAEAAFRRAEAGLATAKAQVSQAEANLSTIETDLTKAVIRSPVEGVVLQRNVEPGQTVAASFQAPVLFKIAQDLRRMELHVDVDEADVSRVKAGQQASFTVDAYPDRSFPARIREVSYASKTVEGVVTYEAILDVDNQELLLRPGMTATADVTVEKIDDALLVDNAALRFTPPATLSSGRNNGGGLVSMLLPRRPRRERPTESPEGSRRSPKSPRTQRIWTLRDGALVPLSITTGSSDGSRTVVTGGDVEPGVPVVIDAVAVGSAGRRS